VIAHESASELIPVPRSVFDDDFFRASARELLAAPPAPVSDSRMPSARGFDSPDSQRPIRLQYEESHRPGAESKVSEPAVRVPVFAGSSTPQHTEADELDIPAFLRRSH
jgi:cell division protein FtsZ